ncbi:hypothetical protein J6X15_00710 [Candidatus Saccharibacteria bacterium]|nr:hypothetical protein [Candidatus Saccharibacteria bacterium]
MEENPFDKKTNPAHNEDWEDMERPEDDGLQESEETLEDLKEQLDSQEKDEKADE